MASVAGPRPPGGVPAAVPSSGSDGPAVQCPALWCPVHPVSSPSGVWPSGVWPSGVHPSVSTRPVSASVRPDASSSSHPGRRWDQVEAAGTVTTGTGRVPVGCRVVERLDGRPSRPGRGRGCRGRGGQWGRWRTRARWGDGGRPRLTGCATRQARPACEAPSLVAARWAREQAPARGAAAAAWLPSGAGWRPRWVVVMGPAARVGGSGRTDGRAGGDGRAAPARPRLAAGAPGSRPTAL
jgi:hypothetical protein